MPNEIDVPESSPEKAEPVSEDVKTPEEEPKKPQEQAVPYSRFKEVNDELARLKTQPAKVINKALDVEDYIDISASLEGLDQKEKERLAREHKLTGKTLSEIRKDEDFLLWQSAYRAKVEKEQLALKPSGTQSESERPQSFLEKLSRASVAEKEKMLSEAGLYVEPKPRLDRKDLGGPR